MKYNRDHLVLIWGMTIVILLLSWVPMCIEKIYFEGKVLIDGRPFLVVIFLMLPYIRKHWRRG